MRAALLSSWLVAIAAACTGPTAPTDASATDAGSDAARADATTVDAGGDAGPLVTGFVFEGPRVRGARPSGSAYTLDLATGTGPAGATIGSPCATGNDCASLGVHAACFRNGASGFCTIDCDLDPEGPSVLCPSGSYCFTSLRADGGRLCLPSCATDADCPNRQMLCSAPLGTFNVGTGQAPACLPLCLDDADCNTDSSGLVCDPTLRRCESPRQALGRNCATNADCRGLGPDGVCLHSTRDPNASYCTVACDPGVADTCALSGTGTDVLGPCVAGYAATAAGEDVPVCLRACASEADCRALSVNTCSYVPALAAGVCTIACTSDADCIDGTCNVATGDCQAHPFWSPRCASDSNCPLDLCVSDFHRAAPHNCSARCLADADCPSGSVCVTSPVALDGAGEHLVSGTGTGDSGFCAPTCTPDAGVCADPTTTCLLPHDPPEIDFAGSGSASSSFCWR